MNTRKQKGEKTCRNQITIFKRINFKTHVVNLSEFSSSLFFLFIQNNRNIVKIIKPTQNFLKIVLQTPHFFKSSIQWVASLSYIWSSHRHSAAAISKEDVLERGVGTVGSPTDFLVRLEYLDPQGLVADLALIRTDGSLPTQLQTIIFPDPDDGGHEVVHHGLGVVRRWSHAESFATASHGRIIDSLDVDVVFIHELRR